MNIEEKIDKILEILQNNKSNQSLNSQIKNIDVLGRVTIPKNIRRDLDIQDGAEVAVYTDNNKIILEILK